ncbi:MAG: phosphoribosyl 1,2-cyclic phosphate phosphodiesterase PhnP [Algoriphagus marincola HL-49]|uniref:Phosphoribosyl 1,2-cyclic phosphate phosphodiesterase PhnP n=1 Tax=Algoriphagus marincola HL-49 TaxID=1305737 RepID=A0A0P7YHB2_9BACT|nr:MAG: phosphoribosyl 1,2-cyclic phosphate phosphodiesterase PhnP [Algoriphagus marincola HL-49]
MNIRFLGTGTSQGVPVIGCDCEVCRSVDFRDKRFRCSVHMETEGKSLVIDTGPDFRMQMLRADIHQLDAVIYTHEHKDHTAGLDDIRPFNFRQKKDMPVYGRSQVLNQIRQEYSYVFSEKKYPGVPQVLPIEIDEETFEVEGITINPIPVMHYKLPVLGFRVGDFTYITDANYISEESKKKIKGSKILVLNALQKTPHLSHFTLEEAIEMAQMLGAEQTYFTHISHKLGLHREVESELPEGIHLAYDGLMLSLP